MTTGTNAAEEVATAATNSAQLILREAQALEILTPEHYENAAALLKGVKRRAGEIEEERKRVLRPLDEARRRIMELFRPAQEVLAQAEHYIKRAVLDYQTEQERRRAEEEARLRELARKEQERLMARAQKAAAVGKDELAETLEEQAQSVYVPVVVSGTPKISGLVTRQNWHAEVTDKAALIHAVAEGKVPDVVLEPNMVILNAQARALKEALDYPGVKAVADQTVAAGRDRDPIPPTPRT